MNKKEILENIKELENKIEILRAIHNHYKKRGDLNRIEQCRDSIEVAFDKLFDLRNKL